jgi:hypothetical protein
MNIGDSQKLLTRTCNFVTKEFQQKTQSPREARETAMTSLHFEDAIN